MAWDVMSGVTKMAWDVMSGVTKTVWDVLSGVANLCGVFCPGCNKKCHKHVTNAPKGIGLA